MSRMGLAPSPPSSSTIQLQMRPGRRNNNNGRIQCSLSETDPSTRVTPVMEEGSIARFASTLIELFGNRVTAREKALLVESWPHQEEVGMLIRGLQEVGENQVTTVHELQGVSGALTTQKTLPIDNGVNGEGVEDVKIFQVWEVLHNAAFCVTWEEEKPKVWKTALRENYPKLLLNKHWCSVRTEKMDQPILYLLVVQEEWECIEELMGWPGDSTSESGSGSSSCNGHDIIDLTARDRWERTVLHAVCFCEDITEEETIERFLEQTIEKISQKCQRACAINSQEKEMEQLERKKETKANGDWREHLFNFDHSGLNEDFLTFASRKGKFDLFWRVCQKYCTSSMMLKWLINNFFNADPQEVSCLTEIPLDRLEQILEGLTRETTDEQISIRNSFCLVMRYTLPEKAKRMIREYEDAKGTKYGTRILLERLRFDEAYLDVAAAPGTPMYPSGKEALVPPKRPPYTSIPKLVRLQLEKMYWRLRKYGVQVLEVAQKQERDKRGEAMNIGHVGEVLIFEKLKACEEILSRNISEYAGRIGPGWFPDGFFMAGVTDDTPAADYAYIDKEVLRGILGIGHHGRMIAHRREPLPERMWFNLKRCGKNRDPTNAHWCISFHKLPGLWSPSVGEDIPLTAFQDRTLLLFNAKFNEAKSTEASKTIPGGVYNIVFKLGNEPPRFKDPCTKILKEGVRISFPSLSPLPPTVKDNLMGVGNTALQLLQFMREDIRIPLPRFDKESVRNAKQIMERLLDWGDETDTEEDV